MSREPINWKVEKNDVKEFIKPVNIELNIDKNLYNYMFINEKDRLLKELEKKMVNTLLKGEYPKNCINALASKMSLTLVPDFENNNWSLRYSPVQIYNAIFEILGMDYRVDCIDYSDQHKVNVLKNDIFMTLLEEREKEEAKKSNCNELRLNFIEDAKNKVNNIFLLKDFDIEERLEDNINYKNLLLYLASKSLDIYMGTENNKEKQEMINNKEDINAEKNKGNSLYYIFPKQYYNEVSSKKRAENPKTMHDSFEGEDIDYENFNKRYIKTLRDNPTLMDNTLDLDTIHVMDRLEAVTADCFNKDMGIIYEDCLFAAKKKIIKPTATKTPKELMNMLEEKIKFYHKLVYAKNKEDQNEVVGVFRGKIDLYGYYGFVLRNNYVVLDSFFKLNSDNMIVPSSEEAVYILPIDLFVKLNGSKSKMMEDRKENENSDVDRRYHTDSGSFRDRIMESIQKEDISTMKADWFLPIYAPHEVNLKK